LSAKPPRYYLIAMLTDQYNDSTRGPIFDAESAIRWLTRSNTNPLNGQTVQEIFYFVIKRGLSFSYIGVHGKDWVIANSLERSKEIQAARQTLVQDPKLSDKDFSHFMELLLSEPADGEAFEQLIHFIIQDKNRIQKFLQKIKQENLFYENAFAQNTLGEVCWKQQDFETAKVYYRRAIELQPDMINALVSLADILIIQDHLEDAKAYLEKAIQYNENYDLSHALLGHILSRQGDVKNAKMHLETALKLNPQSSFAKSELEKIVHVHKVEVSHCGNPHPASKI